MIGFDNWVVVGIQSLLCLCLGALVWKNSFELVLGALPASSMINLVTACSYLPYLALFFNS